MKLTFSPKNRQALFGLLIIFALLAAACGASTAADATPSAAPAAGDETVMLADHPEFGQILVTADGRTLYTNTVDTPENTNCTNIACTGFWPPFTISGEPNPAEGIPGEIGTLTRDDGSTQLTYNQIPLYTFYLDREPGDANGEGFLDFGGTWHVVAVDGTVEEESSPNVAEPGGIQY